MILSRGGYLGRYTPLVPGTPPVHPPGPGTLPLDQVHPPGTRYTPPGPGSPPRDQVHLPETRYTPREKCMPGDTGHKRAVRILLECILVFFLVFFWFLQVKGFRLFARVTLISLGNFRCNTKKYLA